MRQYIGARYMPKFMGTYDPTTAYEALSVVDNGMGTSYVSNQPVPAGTPLSNTTYWAVYGASSGAIINLQDQINAINNDLIKPETSTATFLLMGDSYGPTSGWPTSFNSLLNGGTSIDITEGGRTFVGSTTYLDKITSYVASTSADVLNNIDYLVLLGGIGDSHPESNSSLATKIGEFITYAKAHLPKAKIYLGYIGGGLTGIGGAADPGSATPIERVKAMRVYHNSANANDAFYVSGINNIVNNYYWYTGTGMDGLHPLSATGIGDVIANYLFNFIDTGSATYTYIDHQKISIGSSTNVDVVSVQTDDVTDIRIGKFTYSLQANIGANGSWRDDMVELPITVPVWRSDLSMTMPLTAYDSNGAEVVPITFLIRDHHLYITSTQRKTNSSWWQVDAGKSFDIPLLRFTIPTSMTL